MSALNDAGEMLVFVVQEISNMRGFLLKFGVCCFIFGIGLAVWDVDGQQETFDANEAFVGKTLFRTADWTATGLTCIHCHADFNEKKDPDGKVRPGHSLFNSGYRTLFYKWDRETTHSLKEAIRACMVRWMTERKEEGNTGEEPAEHHLRQLIAFLRSDSMIEEFKAKSIDPMWLDQIPSDRMLKVGDVALGARVYRRSCEICHQMDDSGPAPSLVRNGYSRYQIAKKIRNIDNKGLKGVVMPAFPLDRLSDRELINVAAYVFQM